jgi:hypothetical protein
MGGGFTLRSEVDRGTAVFIDLPAVPRPDRVTAKTEPRALEFLVDKMPRL